MHSNRLQLFTDHALTNFINAFAYISKAYINFFTFIEELVKPVLGFVDKSVSMEVRGNLITDDAFEDLTCMDANLIDR